MLGTHKKIGQLFIVAIVATLLATIQPAKIASTTITPNVMDNLLAIVDSYFFSSTPLYSVPIKKFLRIAFHDCMGGCDASLNLYHTQNRGLELLVSKLNQSYSSKSPNFTYVSKYLSRADFLVLAEERALAWAIKAYGTQPSFYNSTPTFVYGRISNPFGLDNDNLQAHFPDGRANWTVPLTDKNHPTTILEGLLNGLPEITDKDIVTLIGLHGSGEKDMEHCGFQGPWLKGSSVKNKVSNQYYIALFGVGQPTDYMIQLPSNFSKNSNTRPQFKYKSPDPVQNKIQWVAKGAGKGKVFINLDLSIYYNFIANPDGSTPGLYCSQGFNTTLFDCNKADSRYLPLSKYAQQGFKYALNNSVYISDLIPAFLRLVNSTNEFTNKSNLKGFYPKIVCRKGRRVCSGDILMTGCGAILGIC